MEVGQRAGHVPDHQRRVAVGALHHDRVNELDKVGGGLGWLQRDRAGREGLPQDLFARGRAADLCLALKLLRDN